VHNTTNGTFTIKTPLLELKYRINASFPPSTCEDLSILTGNKVWCPNQNFYSSANLNGSFSTTDCYIGKDDCIGIYEDRMNTSFAKGLLSRDGWHVVDDSASALFDGGIDKEWPWRIERDPTKAKDWYFFGYGYGKYRETINAFTAISGRPPLMP